MLKAWLFGLNKGSGDNVCPDTAPAFPMTNFCPPQKELPISPFPPVVESMFCCCLGWWNVVDALSCDSMGVSLTPLCVLVGPESVPSNDSEQKGRSPLLPFLSCTWVDTTLPFICHRTTQVPVPVL